MRLAQLALVLLAACSRAPDMASCRLVGTWRDVQRLPKSLEAEIRSSGKDPAEVMAAAEARMLAEWPDLGDTYHADGTITSNGMLLDHPMTTRMKWRLVADEGDRVSISIPDEKMPDGQWGRTFVFESPDLMREVGGMFEGMKYKRVSDTK